MYYMSATNQLYEENKNELSHNFHLRLYLKRYNHNFTIVTFVDYSKRTAFISSSRVGARKASLRLCVSSIVKDKL